MSQAVLMCTWSLRALKHHARPLESYYPFMIIAITADGTI